MPVSQIAAKIQSIKVMLLQKGPQFAPQREGLALTGLRSFNFFRRTISTLFKDSFSSGSQVKFVQVEEHKIQNIISSIVGRWDYLHCQVLKINHHLNSGINKIDFSRLKMFCLTNIYVHISVAEYIVFSLSCSSRSMKKFSTKCTN